MSARLTTHVLDTMRGVGAGGLHMSLARLSPAPGNLGTHTLDDGGRAILADELEPGTYELVFDVGGYQRAAGLTGDLFLDQVPVRFGLTEGLAHYHVPLLVNPFGYSVYRGG